MLDLKFDAANVVAQEIINVNCIWNHQVHILGPNFFLWTCCRGMERIKAEIKFIKIL